MIADYETLAPAELSDVIAEQLMEIYGWPLDRVEGTADLIAEGIQRAAP